MARNCRGFTLIEILVVITLIAALMSLGFVLLRSAEENKQAVMTTQRIQAISTALTKLSGRGMGGYDMVVPTDPEKLRDVNRNKVGTAIGTPNDTNLGIECVFVALHLKGVNVTLDLDEDSYANTDEDSMAKNPTRTPKDDLMEFVDAWGNPFAYFYGPDMKSWEKYSKYMMGSKLVERARPWKNETTGDWLKADSFQLFSAGPDGKFNTDDDIKSW